VIALRPRLPPPEPLEELPLTAMKLPHFEQLVSLTC